MKIVVVIPTYNEAGNVGLMVPMLAEIFQDIPNHEMVALFVDGNSPDGTSQLVLELATKYSFVHLLPEKEKAGLGAAYIYAFKHAITNLNADAIIEMDADFQHDPHDIPRLVKALDTGSDYVIGSRFARGGSIPAEWQFYRKFLSRGGNLFSKIVLWLWTVSDFTSGFKAARVQGFLDQVDFDAIITKGFAYKIELLFAMHKLGANITEVPIAFGLRDRGDSKMERSNLLDSLRVVLQLRYRESQNFFKFCIVGFTGLLTDIVLFNVFSYFELDNQSIVSGASTASLVSGFIAIFVTFILSNFWSFGDRKLKQTSDYAKSLVLYFAASYIPIIFRSWLIDFAVSTFGDTIIVRNLAFFVGIVVGLVWNFTVYSKVIWKNRK